MIHQSRFVSFLFLLTMSFNIFSEEVSQNISGNNNVVFGKTSGTININFNSLSEKTKIEILAKVVSEELVRLGNKEFSVQNYKQAEIVFSAAKTIDENNFNAFIKQYEAKIKIAKTEKEKELLYTSMISQAEYITQPKRTFSKDKVQQSSILYSMAQKLFPANSKKHKQASASSNQSLAVLMRNAGNELANKQAESALRKNADNEFNKGNYIESIDSYSILFNNFPAQYSLVQINKSIKNHETNTHK